MANEQIALRIKQCFLQQIEAATSLIESLKKERQILTDRKFNDIDRINQDKAEHTLRIESLIREQTHLLKSVGYNLSTDDLDKLIAQQSVALALPLKTLRGQLRDTLESCHELNLVNGSIIAANKQSIETALAILRGQPTTSSLTYGASGQQIKNNSTPPLSKA